MGLQCQYSTKGIVDHVGHLDQFDVLKESGRQLETSLLSSRCMTDCHGCAGGLRDKEID